MPTRSSFRSVRRRASTLLLAALAGCFQAACTDAPGESSTALGLVVLDPQNPERDYDVDVGRMHYGESREHLVRFRNAEGRALAIHRVIVSCSCTVPRVAY